MSKIEYKTDIFTGIRSSGRLTIGNLMGAVHPILKCIEDEKPKQKPLVFVADLHALTDGEPKETQDQVLNVIRTYMALGLDETKANIFIQSHIVKEVSEMSLYLSRLVTLAELMRVPTLKEKLKSGENEVNANLLLAMYPVMMASDILLQQSLRVPVGEDQTSHIEMAKYFARKFNKKYGETFVVPGMFTYGNSVKVKSLSGSGKKMSKTEPNGAIILDDDIEISLKKIKKAQTAFAGENSDSLEALIDIGRFVAKDEEELEDLNIIINKHFAGENVMGEFKNIVSEYVGRFLQQYQEKRDSYTDEYILKFISKGNDIAKQNAEETLKSVRSAMGMKYTSSI